METTLSSHTTTQQEQDMFRTISLTALLTGTLDITSAIIKFYIEHHRGPVPIFRYIASGVFGKETASYGTLMIIWGAVFHFMIAFLFTAFLFLIYPKIAELIKNKFIIGVLFGLFIWTVMNLVVVPLSKASQAPFDIKQAVIAALILIFMIGLPVALIAHQYYLRRNPT
jgi:hypothetical protein